MPASGGNRRFSNRSCCGRYRWCVSWNGTNAWQFHKLGLAWQSVETEREDDSIVALPCEIFGELCPPDKLMEHQEQFIQERDGVHRSGSASEKNVCSQAILLPVLEIASGSVNNGREDDPFTFPNFTMEGAPYDLMANIFCDLEDRRWPFEMMRNMWSWTWLTKLIM